MEPVYRVTAGILERRSGKEAEYRELSRQASICILAMQTIDFWNVFCPLKPHQERAALGTRI